MVFLTCIGIACVILPFGVLIFGDEFIVFAVVALPWLCFVVAIIGIFAAMPEVWAILGLSCILVVGHWIGELALTAIKRGCKLLPPMMINRLCELLPPMMIDIGVIRDI